MSKRPTESEYMPMTVNESPYIVVNDLGDGVELRDYPKILWVSTVCPDANEAFVLLASYVSGRNKEGVRMAFTGPILTRKAPEGVHMAFALPAGFVAKNAPQPSTKAVSIIETRERKLAVVSFSGLANPADYERNLAILRDKLRSRGISTKGEPLLLQYGDRWPDLASKNEIALEVLDSRA